MKKLVLISTLFGIGLVGCGGSSNDASSAPQSSNVLTIQGDKLNQKTTVDQIADNVKISATGNQPISSISWISGGHINEKFKFGQIFLDSTEQNASLWYLGDTIDTNGVLTGFGLDGFSCVFPECSVQPKYLLTKVKDELNLQIKFDNNQYVYKDASTIGKDVTPKSKAIIAQKKDGIIINPTLPTQPDVSTKLVKVTGDLNFKIPSNWPIVQKNRFPIVQMQGDFIFDGKSYEIFKIEHPDVIEQDTFISTIYRVGLKNADDKIFLNISTLESKLDSSVESAISVSADEVKYLAVQLEPQDFWLENSKELKININNVVLTDEKTSEQKILSSNLIIPKIATMITLNGQVLTIPENQWVEANAINDQKLYSLDFGGSSASTSTLQIIHELKGHLSAKYQIGDQSYTCGSREIACVGLSADADQKTYQFNQVKVGSNTLNGSVFIPGVFE